MKPSSYFTCEINDGESIIILEDCYFKYTHKWIKGGCGSYKLFPYLISIELMYKDKPYLRVSVDKINIIDQYIYENDKRNSIFEYLVNRYQELKEFAGEYYSDLPFPISKIDVYED